MKTILCTLLLSTVALCELPPPYPQRGFRPSPQFQDQSSSSQYPQAQYGPPRLQSNTLDVKIPSRLTIEQLIRLTEEIQSSQKRITNRPQTIHLSSPQNSYLPPLRQPQTVYGPPKKIQISQSHSRPSHVSNFGSSQPQSTYGAPQISQQVFRPLTTPQNQYVSEPQLTYGSPNKVQVPQNQYGPPQNSNLGISSGQGTPQTTYGVPNVQQSPQLLQSGSSGALNNFQRPPSTNYGVPDVRTIETFGEVRNKPQTDQDILRQNLLSDLTKQHLPYREPTGFRPQGAQNEVQNLPNINQQYLPANGDNNSGVQRPQTGLQPGNNNNLPQGSLGGGSNTNFIPSSSGSRTGNPSFPQGGTQKANTPTGFRPQENPNIPQNVPSINQQYVPANNGNNVPQNPGNTPLSGGGGLNNVNQNYLPPQTTPRPAFATSATTARPRTIATTPVTPEGTTNYDYDYDIQSQTDAPLNQDGSETDPNVAISNAVAVGGRQFYLQHPDGRLQKVVLQKTQEPNSKPEEYVANYYFQNVQALPSVAYAPLISVGAWK